MLTSRAMAMLGALSAVASINKAASFFMVEAPDRYFVGEL